MLHCKQSKQELSTSQSFSWSDGSYLSVVVEAFQYVPSPVSVLGVLGEPVHVEQTLHCFWSQQVVSVCRLEDEDNVLVRHTTVSIVIYIVIYCSTMCRFVLSFQIFIEGLGMNKEWIYLCCSNTYCYAFWRVNIEDIRLAGTQNTQIELLNKTSGR